MSYDDDFGDEREFRLNEVDDDMDVELGEEIEGAGMHFAEEDKEDEEFEKDRN